MSLFYVTRNVVIAVGFLINGNAYSQALDAQAQALILITNTADRICNVVSSKGESQSSEVQGSVQAQLSGLASRLASAGISGSGKITSDQYQNVLRQDLATTLRDNAACKLKVFDKLHDTILGAVARPAPPLDKSPALPTPSPNPGLRSSGASICCTQSGRQCSVEKAAINSMCVCLESIPPMYDNRGNIISSTQWPGYVCR